MTRPDEPLDLGATAERPDEPSGGGLRRWVALAAAVLVGVGLGLVVADTRDDAAAYADVRLVSGTIVGVTTHADEAAPGSVQVSVLNLGEHEVEILGLEPAGMTVRPDEEPGAPLAAPPGEWVTARQTGLIADCAVTDPGDGVSVRVRDRAGTERVIEADGLPDLMGVNQAWWTVCQGQGLTFIQSDAFPARPDGDDLTMVLLASNPSSQPLQVLRLGAETAGLAVTAPDLPLEVPARESTAVMLTWTITDCEAARGWADVLIDYTFSHGDSESANSQLVPGNARAELVLFVDRSCESGV